MHSKASAQTDTKHEPNFKKTGFGVCKNLRPVVGLGFEAALTAPSIKRFQKTAAVFQTGSYFFAFVCSLARRRDCGPTVHIDFSFSFVLSPLPHPPHPSTPIDLHLCCYPITAVPFRLETRPGQQERLASGANEAVVQCMDNSTFVDFARRAPGKGSVRTAHDSYSVMV